MEMSDQLQILFALKGPWYPLNRRWVRSGGGPGAWEKK